MRLKAIFTCPLMLFHELHGPDPLGGPNKAGAPDTAVQDGDALFFRLASPDVFSAYTKTVSCTTIHFKESAGHM